MKWRSAIAIPLWAAAAIAQSRDPAGVLERARTQLHEVIGRLSKYTCTETVNRSYFRENGPVGRTCDDIVANKNKGRVKLQLTATDRLRLDVAVTDNGAEIYSWPDAGRIGARRIEDLAAGGTIGTGPFGAFLSDIFENSGAELIYQDEQSIDGQRLLRYRFRVPLNASHYGVQAGAAAYRRIPYDGTFWLDADAALRRLIVRTGELEQGTGSCEATTTVDFEHRRIGEDKYLVPREGLLHTIGRTGAETENVTTYAGCREYRGESVVNFQAAGNAPDTTAAVSKQRGEPLPPGLPISLVLETVIDTGIAAAGDPVVARIRKDVVELPSKRLLAPAGATVRGRITHMEHHVDGRSYFLVTLNWDEMETGGLTFPFAAILDHPLRLLDPDKPNPCSASVQQVESQGLPAGGGTLVLPSHAGRYVTPSGCESGWLTIAVPK